MAWTIKPFRSNTAGAVPTTANLADGEMAVNSADKKVYLRVGSSIVEVANVTNLSDYARLSVDNTWTAKQTFNNGAGLPNDGIFTFGTSGASIRGNAAGLILGASSSGTSLIYLRPNGESVATGQVTVNSSGLVTAPGFSGPLTGNADTATSAITAGSAATLTTARTINGTSFNGSANITTANWGTVRTLTIGGTGKSVNGSANVAWSLTEIGAAGRGAIGASGLTMTATHLLGRSTTGTGAPEEIDVGANLQLANGILSALGKNKLINGDFRYWQRGTVSAAAASRRYVADRWEAWASGSSMAVDAVALTVPDVPFLPIPRYAHRVVVSSVAGTNNFAHVRQQIEDVRNFAGSNATFSTWVYTPAAGQLAFNVDQYFGGGGAIVNGAGQKTTTVAGWNYVTFTVAVPSVSGKTIGEGSSLVVNIWLDAGSSQNARTASLGQRSGTYWFANAQMEEGSVATPFEWRPDALELLLCQRYAYVFRFPEGPAHSIVTRLGSNGILGWIDAFCDMRSVPAASFLSGQIAFSDGVPLSSPSLAPVSVRRVAFQGNVATGTPNTTSYVTGVVGNPAVVLLDAEH